MEARVYRVSLFVVQGKHLAAVTQNGCKDSQIESFLPFSLL